MLSERSLCPQDIIQDYQRVGPIYLCEPLWIACKHVLNPLAH